ncbi:MAG: hypothetical protein HY681_12760 [Chloroflexi bacterium]|nr:hypothetical protein [Chloroflexota bacterium]
MEKVLSEFGKSHDTSTVSTHIGTHCVANTKPNPLSQDHRMLFRTGRGRFRLYRPEDPFDPRRADGAVLPQAKDLPAKHRHLLDWYRDEYVHWGKVFTADALLLKVKPGNSGLADVSVNHDKYLAQAVWEESHAVSPNQAH